MGGAERGGCCGRGDLDEDEGEVVAQVGCAGCDGGDGGRWDDGFDDRDGDGAAGYLGEGGYGLFVVAGDESGSAGLAVHHEEKENSDAVAEGVSVS